MQSDGEASSLEEMAELAGETLLATTIPTVSWCSQDVLGRDKHQTIMKRMLRFGRPTAAYSDLQVPYEPLTTLLQVYHVPESKFQHLLNPNRFRRSLEDT